MKLDHPVKSVSPQLLMYSNILLSFYFLFILPFLFPCSHLLSAQVLWMMCSVLKSLGICVPMDIYSALQHCHTGFREKKKQTQKHTTLFQKCKLCIMPESKSLGWQVWCEAGNMKWRDKAEKEHRRGNDKTKNYFLLLVQHMNICLWVPRVIEL